jgi:ribosomal-protein-alanine N-acetyltransferase
MEAGNLGVQAVLRTARLVLDAFTPADVAQLVSLANRPEISATTLAIPHPYTEDDARRFLALVELEHRNGSALTFAIRLAEASRLVGAIGLKDIDDVHAHAELGYWVGVEWWGKGIATEAARAVLDYAFDCRGLNRVAAHHMVRNPASGAVLEHVGMRREGVLRERVLKEGRFEDVVLYAMLRSDPRPS